MAKKETVGDSVHHDDKPISNEEVRRRREEFLNKRFGDGKGKGKGLKKG
jgi:hypothetical protein